MNLNVLAWRNLWRRKRRTLITAFSIAFGVILAVTFTATGDYYYTRMIDSAASMGMGHIALTAKDYNRAPSIKKRLTNVANLYKTILNNSSHFNVTDVVVRITGQALFASANKTIGGMFIAIDPRQETIHNNLFLRAIKTGSLFSSANSPGVIIGIKMAKKLHLRIGKKIIYTTTDAHGEIVSAIERVSAIFKTGVDEIDSSVVILPIRRVQKVLSYNKNEATLIALILDDQRKTPSTKQKLESTSIFSDIEILTWQQSQPDLAGMIEMDQIGNYISQLLIAVLVAAGILNTMLMSVLERKREFAVMMAVGMAPSTLSKLVLVESFWLAIVGLIIGVLITIPWYLYMSQIGLDLTEAYGESMDFGGIVVDPILKMRLFSDSILIILIGLFTLALSAGCYPAWRAGHIPPVESLKTN